MTVEERLRTTDPDYRVQQIKEKFGTLRFYWSGQSNDAAKAAVAEAEAEVCDAVLDSIRTRAVTPRIVTQQPPALPAEDGVAEWSETACVYTQVLIVGGGPAGICAAAELGRVGAQVLLEIGEVVGISLANREVRVCFQEGTGGIWFAVGQIYPAFEATEAGRDSAPLSQLADQACSAPAGGFSVDRCWLGVLRPPRFVG